MRVSEASVLKSSSLICLKNKKPVCFSYCDCFFFPALSIFTCLNVHYVWLKELILYKSITDAFFFIILSP